LRSRFLELERWQCRTPFRFINEPWLGDANYRQSFLLGAHYGLFCVGIGSIGWMLVIGAVMTTEKNFRWGKRLNAPLGGSLLLASAAVFAMNV
jgi:predicted metal-binding membrane protein